VARFVELPEILCPMESVLWMLREQQTVHFFG
jgi:hypothetical protein